MPQMIGIFLHALGALRVNPVTMSSLSALRVNPVTMSSLSNAERSWDVTVNRDGQRHTLRVSESEPILVAVERAGLLPSSECRRGNCLSCAAQVVSGAPFSLRVEGCTALCDEAHLQGLVLLCSAYAVGPDLEVALGYDGEAWEVQHSTRWRPDAPPLPPKAPDMTHFRLPEDAVELFTRCAELPDAEPQPSDEA